MIKPSLFFFVLIICTMTLFAQHKVDINTPWIEIIKADSSVGIFEETYIFNHPPEGYYLIYNNSMHEELIMQGAFLNSKMEGLWIYYKDGKINESIHYKSGFRQGEYCSYYSSGQIKIHGLFNKGILNGAYVIFNEDGSVRVKYTFINGEIEK